MPVVTPQITATPPAPSGRTAGSFISLPLLLLALITLLALLLALWWKRRQEGEVLSDKDWMPGGEFIMVPGSGAKESATSSIINVLNEIDGQLKDLEQAVRGAVILSPQQANAAAERFFLTAQVVEEQMKNPTIREQLTPAQIEQLNTQLQGAVEKIIALSRQSEPLLNAVQARYAEGQI